MKYYIVFIVLPLSLLHSQGCRVATPRSGHQSIMVPVSAVILSEVGKTSLWDLKTTYWMDVRSYFYCRSILTGERYNSSYNYNHTFILFEQLYAQLPPQFLQYNAEYRCPVYPSSAASCGIVDETFEHEQDVIVNEFAVRWEEWVTLHTHRGCIM